MEQFWGCSKVGGVYYHIYVVMVVEHYTKSEKELWFDVGKIMWRG